MIRIPKKRVPEKTKALYQFLTQTQTGDLQAPSFLRYMDQRFGGAGTQVRRFTPD